MVKEQPRYDLMQYSKDTWSNGTTYRMVIGGEMIEEFHPEDVDKALNKLKEVCFGNLENFYLHRNKWQIEDYGKLYLFKIISWDEFYNERASDEFIIDGEVCKLDVNLKLSDAAVFGYSSFIDEKVVEVKNNIIFDVDTFYYTEIRKVKPTEDEINEIILYAL